MCAVAHKGTPLLNYYEPKNQHHSQEAHAVFNKNPPSPTIPAGACGRGFGDGLYGVGGIGCGETAVSRTVSVCPNCTGWAGRGFHWRDSTAQEDESRSGSRTGF